MAARVPNFSISPVGAAGVFRITGEIDAHTAPHIESSVAGIDPQSQVVLDLAAVEFMPKLRS